nr:DUF4349 domain-containing protein [uncultured Flavobacterium sp.]
MRTLFACLTLMLIFCSCNEENKQSIAYDETISVEAAAVGSAPPPPMEENIEAAKAIPGTVPQPKIIKTGTLRFETDNLDESYAAVQKAIARHKASIQNDDSGKNYESVYRNITIRVPSASFDAFIAEISQGVKHFDQKEISSQDVTEEYIDVEARLNAKRVLEKRYFELLNKATKISEMLEIEKQLSAIREEIEAKEGRLKYLQNRVSMSMVHLQMYTKNASESGATVSYFGKMWNALKDGFNNIATFFLGLLHIWPFILIFVIGFVFLRRRFRRKTT